MTDRLPFAAPLVYSTKGQSPISAKSRRLRDRIKRGDEELLRQIVEYIAQLVADDKFPGFFAPDVTLVPVPGHTPLAPGATSTPQRIALALVQQRLGSDVAPILERRQPVQKSAFAAPNERPRARNHAESMAVSFSLLRPRAILMVDDFVTRGATMLGAASCLQIAMPLVPIRGFALVRSITDGEITAIREPCVGVLELTSDGESKRRP